MVSNSAGSSAADSPLEDVEFLSRSAHRVAALDALAERPRTRADLRQLTGASSSTVARLLAEFDARHWVVRRGDRYEATTLGAFVSAGMQELLDRLETERKLRDVWPILPLETTELQLEMLSDATVTVAEASDPYRPVNRFVSLLRETTRFRFVGSDLALLEPCKDELCRRIADGMETEIVDPPQVADYVRSTYPEMSSETLASGNLTVFVHDELPTYGITIFDDRTGIAGYDPANGTVRVLIDTDSPAVREWATSTYESYRREARPLAPPVVQ